MATPPLALDAASSADFWRSLCPDLHVEGQPPVHPSGFGDLKERIQDLLREGYVNIPVDGG
ncbi:MAG: hypothetical protein EXR72_12720 [Myxococcales bacterium]|nr:hypothetical protein [Myxococcales bacterium]